MSDSEGSGVAGNPTRDAVAGALRDYDMSGPLPWDVLSWEHYEGLADAALAARVGVEEIPAEDLKIANERGDAWREIVKQDTVALEYITCPSMGYPSDVPDLDPEAWVRAGHGTEKNIRLALATCIATAKAALARRGLVVPSPPTTTENEKRDE